MKKKDGASSKSASPSPIKQSRAMNGSGPRIDIFAGGSLFSEYTKSFLGLKKKVEHSSEDECEGTSPESTENEIEDDCVDDSVQEQNVWNGGKTYYNDGDRSRPLNGSVEHLKRPNSNQVHQMTPENGHKRPEIWI